MSAAIYIILEVEDKYGYGIVAWDWIPFTQTIVLYTFKEEAYPYLVDVTMLAHMAVTQSE